MATKSKAPRARKTPDAVVPVAPASPRLKLDGDNPFVEGYTIRQASATGYPFRPDTPARLTVELDCHGPAKSGQPMCVLRVTQSDGPNSQDDLIEIYGDDLNVFCATITKAVAIARATGVFATPDWHDPEHVRPAVPLASPA